MLSGVIHTPSLLVSSAIMGSANAFYLPASKGLIPATVAPDLLRQANAIMAVSRRTAMLVGPSIATALVLGAGFGWAVLFDGLTFAANVICLAMLTVPLVKREQRSFFADIRSGWAEVRRHRWFWSNIGVHGVWNFARCFYFVTGAMVVITSIGGQIGWGIVTQATTIGAFVGAVVALRVKVQHPLVASNVCLAFGALPLIVAFHMPIPVIAICSAVMTAVLGMMDTLWTTTVQQHIPEHAISKASAYDWFASISLNPVGMAVATPIGIAIGATPALLAAAGLILLATLSVLALPDVRGIRAANVPRTEPEPAAA